MALKDIWHRKVIRPIIHLLKQGITPQKIVLSIAFGVVLGIIPMLGTTTILCTIAALFFRLNLVAIQLVNYLVYPLQILLLIPFYRGGELLFQSEQLQLSASQVLEMIEKDVWATVMFLWDTTVHAVVVWAFFAPVLVGVLYSILLPIVKRLPFREPNAAQVNRNTIG